MDEVAEGRGKLRMSFGSTVSAAVTW